MQIFQVTAHYDIETRRWTAYSDQIPGLVCEAKSYDDLRKNIADLAPIMLSENTNFSDYSFGININMHEGMSIDLPVAAE